MLYLLQRILSVAGPLLPSDRRGILREVLPCHEVEQSLIEEASVGTEQGRQARSRIPLTSRVTPRSLLRNPRFSDAFFHHPVQDEKIVLGSGHATRRDTPKLTGFQSWPPSVSASCNFRRFSQAGLDYDDIPIGTSYARKVACEANRLPRAPSDRRREGENGVLGDRFSL